MPLTIHVHLHFPEPKPDPIPAPNPDRALLQTLLRNTKEIIVMSGSMQTQLDQLSASLVSITNSEDAIEAMIAGFAAQMQAAVDAALAAGASQAQVAAFTELNTAMTAKAAELAADAVAGTPQA